MIDLTPEASAQLLALERFYVEKQRPQALRNLRQSLTEASAIIARTPECGLPAPRPYPDLAKLGLSWLKVGRYWIAYDRDVPVIAGLFFETDDIPNRIL